MADVNAFSGCIHTCNLMGDGDWRLVAADADKKLKVWRGTQKASEHPLLEAPCAITSFVSDASPPRLPNLAVATGCHIHMFRSLRPYQKFTLPSTELHPSEVALWAQLDAGEVSPDAGAAMLAELQHCGGAQLCERSRALLAAATPAERCALVARCKGQDLSRPTSVTCMDVVRQAVDEPDAISCLVVGTEDGRVLIFNSAATAVARSMNIGSPPSFMAVTGTLDMGYRVTLAARDARLYNVKSGTLSKTVVHLDTHAVGVVRCGKSILVGCMNSVVHCYSGKGRRSYSLYMPAPISVMQLLATNTARMSKCLIVALANGEVRVYNDRTLVSLHTCSSPVVSLVFGRYAREDNTLVAVTKAGALEVKILPRHANLEVSSAPGPPPEQDVPLAVPRRGRLAVEAAAREREGGALEMHAAFQAGLCRLRLATARALVKVLTDGQGPAAHSSAANVSMQASVQGLGPHFQVLLSLCNEGTTPVLNTQVLFQFQEQEYSMPTTRIVLPMLVPQLQYTYRFDIFCVAPSAAPGVVTILLLERGSGGSGAGKAAEGVAAGLGSAAGPLMVAQLRMPAPEAADW